MKLFKIICIIICVSSLSSCAALKSKDKDEEVQTVDEMYNDATRKLENKSYEKAIEKFEELERTYPYSKWATKSQIMAAYAAYKNEDYNTALLALERFTKLHPGNKDIQYAYYLRALSFYEQISDAKKDQSYSLYAKSALQEVIARFPNSKYAKDATFKLDLVNDHLAGKEVEVGRFYQKRGKPIAAINRFKKVVEHYDTTAHTPEALHRLVESYMALGVKEEAIKYASVLGYNFPDNKWYERSYYLIEGKKPETFTNKTQGKWYDFKNWKGLRFIKSKFTGEAEDISEELVEDKGSEPYKGDSDDGFVIKVEENVGQPRELRWNRAMKKIKGWFDSDDEKNKLSDDVKLEIEGESDGNEKHSQDEVEFVPVPQSKQEGFFQKIKNFFK